MRLGGGAVAGVGEAGRRGEGVDGVVEGVVVEAVVVTKVLVALRSLMLSRNTGRGSGPAASATRGSV